MVDRNKNLKFLAEPSLEARIGLATGQFPPSPPFGRFFGVANVLATPSFLSSERRSLPP